MESDLTTEIKAKLQAIESLPAGEQPDAYRELQKMLERLLENNED